MGGGLTITHIDHAGLETAQELQEGSREGVSKVGQHHDLQWHLSWPGIDAYDEFVMRTGLAGAFCVSLFWHFAQPNGPIMTCCSI